VKTGKINLMQMRMSNWKNGEAAERENYGSGSLINRKEKKLNTCLCFHQLKEKKIAEESCRNHHFHFKQKRNALTNWG